MKKKRALAVVGSICLTLVLAALLLPACAAEEAPTPTPTPTPTPAPAGPIELSFAYWGPPTSSTVEGGIAPFIEEVGKRTNGRVKITLFSGGALGKGADHIYMTRDGIADIAYTALSYTPGLFDLQEVGAMPFACSDPMKLDLAMMHLRKMGYFEEEYREYGVKQLHSLASTPYHWLLAKKKPTTVEELAGIKVRSPGGYMAKGLTALGAIPVQVTAAESYQALQTGIIDTHMHLYSMFEVYKTYEISKYVLELGFGNYASTSVIMNIDKWNSLTPEDQKILQQVSDEAEFWYTGNWQRADVEAKALCQEAGIEIYTLPPAEMEKLKTAVSPIWEEFIATCAEKGKPGKEIVEEFNTIISRLGLVPSYVP